LLLCDEPDPFVVLTVQVQVNSGPWQTTIERFAEPGDVTLGENIELIMDLPGLRGIPVSGFPDTPKVVGSNDGGKTSRDLIIPRRYVGQQFQIHAAPSVLRVLDWPEALAILPETYLHQGPSRYSAGHHDGGGAPNPPAQCNGILQASNATCGMFLQWSGNSVHTVLEVIDADDVLESEFRLYGSSGSAVINGSPGTPYPGDTPVVTFNNGLRNGCIADICPWFGDPGEFTGIDNGETYTDSSGQDWLVGIPATEAECELRPIPVDPSSTFVGEWVDTFCTVTVTLQP
jgi:hypothetical protein